MTSELQDRLRHCQQVVTAVAAIAIVAACVGASKEPNEFFRSYAFAYLFWIGIPVGSGLVLVFANLTSAEWVAPVRLTLESAARSFPVNVVTVIPLLLGVRHIYPWATSNRPAVPLYLNAPFWITRGVLFLILWTFLLWKITSTDTTVRTRWSAVAAVSIPITAAFAYVDWFMSLQSRWASTAFSITTLSAQVLVALSITILLLALLRSEDWIRTTFSLDRLHQLGNLLLTFVLFWAYLAFSQFLIIYSANLPHEISWYQRRSAGSWALVSIAIAALQFALPFVLLLFRSIKRSVTRLASVSAVILISNIIYCYWVIAPSFGDSGKELSWLDPVLFVALGAIYVVAFIGHLRRAKPLFRLGSIRDPGDAAYANT